MSSNVIAFPNNVLHYRRRAYRARRDFLVIREDGLGAIGTRLSKRIEAGPPEVIDDLHAGMRLAREAAERDD